MVDAPPLGSAAGSTRCGPRRTGHWRGPQGGGSSFWLPGLGPLPGPRRLGGAAGGGVLPGRPLFRCPPWLDLQSDFDAHAEILEPRQDPAPAPGPMARPPDLIGARRRRCRPFVGRAPDPRVRRSAPEDADGVWRQAQAWCSGNVGE